jgi:multidrug efflux pump subunit AcrA (membrane-fusion protein)
MRGLCIYCALGTLRIKALMSLKKLLYFPISVSGHVIDLPPYRIKAVFVAICFVILAFAFPITANSQQGRSASKVEVAMVTEEMLTPSVDIEARIVIGQERAVTAPIDGIVRFKNWQVGDRVEKGAVLAIQDSGDMAHQLNLLQLDLAQTIDTFDEISSQLEFEKSLLVLAEQQLALQQDKLNRLTTLANEQIIPKDRMDEAMRTHLAARQILINQRQNISKLEADLDQSNHKKTRTDLLIKDILADIKAATLVAPVTGQLVALPQFDAQYFREGEMITKIRTVNDYELEADVPITWLPYLRQAGVISGTDAEGQVLTAVLRSELPEENQRTSTRPVRFRITSPLSLAMMADAAQVQLNIPVADQRLVMTIPVDAMIPKGFGAVVFVVEDNKAILTEITIGEVFGDKIIVKSGLNPGQNIISKGNEGLRDGAEIMIISGGDEG